MTNGIVDYPKSEMYEIHHDASKIVSSTFEVIKILQRIGIAWINSGSFGEGFPLIKFARHQTQFLMNIEFES